MVTPRQARIGVDIATGIVVASVGVALAGLTWRLAGDPGVVATPPVMSAPSMPVEPETADLTPALALAPFGRAALVAGPSTSGVELRGVLLTQPRSASSALIGAPGGPVRAYYVGQEVAGGATLETVAIDHVLLRVADRIERLELPKPSAAGGGTTEASDTPQVSPPPPPPPPSGEVQTSSEESGSNASAQPTTAQIEAFIRARGSGTATNAEE